MSIDKTERDFDDNEDNLIVLKDEQGEDIYFELLDLVEYKGNEYIVLMPADEEEDEDDEELEKDVVILMVEPNQDDDEESHYSSVEDEDILEAVFELFKEKYKDDFDFV